MKPVDAKFICADGYIDYARVNPRRPIWVRRYSEKHGMPIVPTTCPIDTERPDVATFHLYTTEDGSFEYRE